MTSTQKLAAGATGVILIATAVLILRQVKKSYEARNAAAE